MVGTVGLDFPVLAGCKRLVNESGGILYSLCADINDWTRGWSVERKTLLWRVVVFL